MVVRNRTKIVNMSDCNEDKDVQNMERVKTVNLMYEPDCDHPPSYDCQDSFCMEEAFSKNVREFLENPPSDEITSLKLTGLDQLEQVFPVRVSRLHGFEFNTLKFT